MADTWVSLGQDELDLDVESLQPTLWSGDSFASTEPGDDDRRSLDALVGEAQRYRSSAAYRGLLTFIAGFHWYAPYNAMLVDLQKPGSTYVATRARWWRDFDRVLGPGAQPLIMLQPGGPVMIVYDVSDTTATPSSRELPIAVTRPFETKGRAAEGAVRMALARAVDNAVRDGVRVTDVSMGSQLAGSVERAAGSVLSRPGARQGRDPAEGSPLRYEIRINDRLGPLDRYASVAHELAHVYCGHLGTPDRGWWPDRQTVPKAVREFEAESAAHLAVRRLDPEAEMPPYLHGYLEREGQVPDFSLDLVLRVAGALQAMSEARLRPRRRSTPRMRHRR